MSPEYEALIHAHMAKLQQDGDNPLADTYLRELQTLVAGVGLQELGELLHCVQVSELREQLYVHNVPRCRQ